MISWSAFRVGHYSSDDHREDTLLFTYGEISHDTANSECFEKCEQAKKVEINLKLLRNILNGTCVQWNLPETVGV